MQKETLILTPDGKRTGPRPDILYRDQHGNIKAINVGLTEADGTPVKREEEALEDLNDAGLETIFERYD